MTAVFHVHSHLLVGGGTSGHIGPLPGRDSDAARTHAATRGAGETRAAGLADLRLGYARPSADQTGHPTCRWPANFAVARQEFVDQVFGVSHEALDDTPAALFGSADERSDRSEIVCTLERAEAARDFLLELHHPAVAFSLVVGERHIRVGQEAQNSLFVVSQAQDEVMPDATLWAAGARGAVLPQFLWQSREPLVKGCSDRNDCIVAPTNEVDQALIGGLLFVPRQVLDMAGTAQQDLHLAPPVFLLNLEQCFEFAQVMGVAKRVLDARHGVVRLPVVMHHNAADTAQHVTAIDADAVVRQPSCGRDMQPLQSFDDAKPGLVEVLDWGEQDQLTHRVGKAEQALTRPVTHLLDGRARQAHVEEIEHQRGEAIQRHELKGREIDDDGGDPIAILHRRADPLGKRALGHRTAGRATAAMGAVLGHHKWFRLRQIKDLTGVVIAALKAPLILIGIYCGLGGCDFLASALLFITGGVPLPCDPVDLPFLAKVACGRLAFYSTALKL